MGMFDRTPLQTKITWVIMLAALATLLLAVVAFFTLEVGEFRSSMTRELRSIAGIIATTSEAALEFNDPKAGAQTLSVLNADSRIIAAALYNEKGEIFATYESPANTAALPSQPRPDSSINNRDGLAVFRAIPHQSRTVGTIYVRASNHEVYERLSRHGAIAALVLALCGFAAYLISLRLRGVISKPILNLADAARKVSEHGDYSVRAVKESEDETGMLVDQFNKMLEEIGKKNQALLDTAHQLKLITDSLPALIAYVDREERYQFNNASYETWFNKSPKDLKGRHLREVIGEQIYTETKPHIEAALTGKVATSEQLLRFNGTPEKFISSVYIPDIDTNGTVKGFFTLTTDITERKRAEDELRSLNEALEQRVTRRTQELEQSQERLRNSERLASIGTLAAGVAHEIRNPLNSILLIAQYALRYRVDLDDAMKDMLKNISSEATRCATIIKNILLFAKAEKTDRTAQDINSLIRHSADIAKGYFGSSRLQVSLQLQEQEMPVLLNSTEIEQVLINLINNAAEATTHEVRVLLTTEQIENRVRLRITDDGPGIPDEIINHIFDPFFSTKRKNGNTGLGLSLSHGIIADHGGTISVSSEVGVGTTFSIELALQYPHEENLGN